MSRIKITLMASCEKLSEPAADRVGRAGSRRRNRLIKPPQQPEVVLLDAARIPRRLSHSPRPRLARSTETPSAKFNFIRRRLDIPFVVSLRAYKIASGNGRSEDDRETFPWKIQMKRLKG